MKEKKRKEEKKEREIWRMRALGASCWVDNSIVPRHWPDIEKPLSGEQRLLFCYSGELHMIPMEGSIQPDYIGRGERRKRKENFCRMLHIGVIRTICDVTSLEPTTWR